MKKLLVIVCLLLMHVCCLGQHVTPNEAQKKIEKYLEM